MTTTLTLEIRLWKPGEDERIIDGRQMLLNYDSLKDDAAFLDALMIDNLKMGLSVDGHTVSRCVFMFNGDTSPDMMQFYEQHLPELYKGQTVSIEFYDEQTIWRISPDGHYEVIDTSHGYDEQTTEAEGELEPEGFITSAYDWIDTAIAVLERYAGDSSDIASQAEWMRKLREFSLKAMAELGWKR